MGHRARQIRHFYLLQRVNQLQTGQIYPVKNIQQRLTVTMYVNIQSMRLQDVIDSI
jgi:hypothetical protein